MGRPLRPLVAGATYHVTTRGNERRNVFRDDHDRRKLLAGLSVVAEERRWDVLTYCLMTNHVHLVVRTPEPDLSRGMHKLFGDYARTFNVRHDRVGHLFSSRFHARLVSRDAHLLELYRYVALNPVRAGLVDRPEDFRWGAHASLCGLATRPAFLSLRQAVELFGSRARYRSFVEDDADATMLARLLAVPTPDAVRCATDAGYSRGQIADALGWSRSKVARHLA